LLVARPSLPKSADSAGPTGLSIFGDITASFDLFFVILKAIIPYHKELGLAWPAIQLKVTFSTTAAARVTRFVFWRF
jgi:hypothetical protein